MREAGTWTIQRANRVQAAASKAAGSRARAARAAVVVGGVVNAQAGRVEDRAPAARVVAVDSVVAARVAARVAGLVAGPVAGLAAVAAGLLAGVATADMRERAGARGY
jgi:hypothetical protein